MPFDLKKYVDSLELDDAEKSAMQKIFAKEKNVAEMNRGYSARDEASRLMDEGTKAKTEAEVAKQAAATEKAEADRIKAETIALDQKNKDWAAALRKYETETQQTQTERDALAAEKVAYEAYLESIGVEPSFALSGKQPIKPPAPALKEPPVLVADPPKPVVDPDAMKDYLKRDDVVPAVNLLSNLPFELSAIHFQHQDLYGKPAPIAEMKKVQEAYLNPQNSRPLSEIAAETFHFADREKELSEQALEERAKTMAQEMYTKRLSELHLPSAAIDQIPSDMSSAVKFASKGFSENSGRATEANTGVSEEEMQQFLQIDQELAAQGIRP